MKNKLKKISQTALDEIHYRVELAILYDFFQIKRPKILKEVDEYTEEGVTEYIRIISSSNGVDEPLSNAVARLVLSNIQNRLPQWAAVYADGSVTLGQEITSSIQRKVETLPQFLFEINWADSGSGYSWPERYYVSYIPGFHKYVVTLSQDSAVAHGYCDLVIDTIDGDSDPIEACRDIITSFWEGHYLGWEQGQWVDIWSTGLIESEEIDQWGDDVWKTTNEDEEVTYE